MLLLALPYFPKCWPISKPSSPRRRSHKIWAEFQRCFDFFQCQELNSMTLFIYCGCSHDFTRSNSRQNFNYGPIIRQPGGTTSWGNTFTSSIIDCRGSHWKRHALRGRNPFNLPLWRLYWACRRTNLPSLRLVSGLRGYLVVKIEAVSQDPFVRLLQVSRNCREELTGRTRSALAMSDISLCDCTNHDTNSHLHWFRWPIDLSMTHWIGLWNIRMRLSRESSREFPWCPVDHSFSNSVTTIVPFGSTANKYEPEGSKRRQSVNGLFCLQRECAKVSASISGLWMPPSSCLSSRRTDSLPESSKTAKTWCLLDGQPANKGRWPLNCSKLWILPPGWGLGGDALGGTSRMNDHSPPWCQRSVDGAVVHNM